MAVYRPDVNVRLPAPWLAAFVAAAVTLPHCGAPADTESAYLRADSGAYVRPAWFGSAVFAVTPAAVPRQPQPGRGAYARADPVTQSWPVELASIFAPADPVYTFKGSPVQNPAAYPRDGRALPAISYGAATFQIVVAGVPATVPAIGAAYARPAAPGAVPRPPLAGLFTPADPIYTFDGIPVQAAAYVRDARSLPAIAVQGSAPFGQVAAFVFPSPVEAAAAYGRDVRTALSPVAWASIDASIPGFTFATPVETQARAVPAPLPVIVAGPAALQIVAQDVPAGLPDMLAAYLRPAAPGAVPRPPLAGLLAVPSAAYIFAGPVLQDWQAFARFEWSAAWLPKIPPQAALLSTVVFADGRRAPGGHSSRDPDMHRTADASARRLFSMNTKRTV